MLTRAQLISSHTPQPLPVCYPTRRSSKRRFRNWDAEPSISRKTGIALASSANLEQRGWVSGAPKAAAMVASRNPRRVLQHAGGAEEACAQDAPQDMGDYRNMRSRRRNGRVLCQSSQSAAIPGFAKDWGEGVRVPLHYRKRAGKLVLDDHQALTGDAGISRLPTFPVWIPFPDRAL